MCYGSQSLLIISIRQRVPKKRRKSLSLELRLLIKTTNKQKAFECDVWIKSETETENVGEERKALTSQTSLSRDFFIIASKNEKLASSE